MAGLSDFVGMASKSLGIGDGAARAGVGTLLQEIQKAAPAADFAALTKALPDASAMAASAPAGGGSGGGLGGLLGKAASALGGGAGGGAMGVLAKLQGAGIDPSKALPFAQSFVTFLKGKVSPDLLQRLLGKVGDLGKLLG
jgi:hypothetical protein